MKTRNFIIIICIGISLNSCSDKIYQITTFESKQVDKNFIQKNEDLEVDYDFRSIGGKLNITITNKSDDSICINWAQCSFTYNNVKCKNETLLYSDDIYHNTNISKNDTLVYIAPNSKLKRQIANLNFPFLKDKVINNINKLFNDNNSLLSIQTSIVYVKSNNEDSLKYIQAEFRLQNIYNSKIDETGELNLKKNQFYTFNENINNIASGIGIGASCLFLAGMIFILSLDDWAPSANLNF